MLDYLIFFGLLFLFFLTASGDKKLTSALIIGYFILLLMIFVVAPYISYYVFMKETGSKIGLGEPSFLSFVSYKANTNKADIMLLILSAIASVGILRSLERRSTKE